MTTEQVIEPTEKTADSLVGRLVEATIGSMDLLTVYIGDGEGGPLAAERVVGGANLRCGARARPLHHSLFGERSPTPASQGR